MSEVEKVEALIARLTKPTRQLHRHTRALITKSSPAIQHEAATAIRALLDELSRLREALKPFGRFAISETWLDQETIPARIAVGDIRRARALSNRSQEGRADG